MMPPAVRIESKAWDDPAFAVLAMRIGWPDADMAIIKCARVWAHATEQNDPTIPTVEVDAIARTPGFALHMVAARLADVSDKNSEAIVLRGATGKNRNRISWLATKRKNSRKGGSANGAKWGAKGEPIGFGSAVPKGSPNTPAPAPAHTKEDLSCASDAPSGAGVLVSVEPVPRFDFAAIYGRYPRKVGKTNGLKRLASSVKSAGDYAALVRALGVYLAHVAGKDKQYIRQFDTWTTTWRDWLEADAADTTTHAPLSDFDRRLLAAESKRMGGP